MVLKQHPKAIWHILVRLILLCTFSVTQINQPVFADSPTNRQTLLQAAEITYSKENDVITALGNVELSQGSRILLADKVIYRQKKDEVTAEGNVILLEPNGEVLFSTKVVLSDKLKSGLIKDFKLLMNDGSRFAANSAIRSDGNRNVMKKAIFSPCHPCKDNPNKPLVWQIKAKQITHYEDTKDLEYEGALLEIFDLPIFYMPYFIHPDPSVERRSGFLIPTVGHSDEKGFIYGQPYFQVIDEARDIKLEPSIYTRKGIILKTHYRHALERGNIDLKTTTGVIANNLNETGFNDVALKGSIDLEAKFAIDDTWRTSFDLEQTSNKNYQRKFDLVTKEVLTSRAVLEGFRSRNYTSLSLFKFQGLRVTDDRRAQPFVFPTLNYNFTGQPNTYGIRPEIDLEISSITRELGVDSRKLSLKSGLQMPFYSDLGEIYTFHSSLQTDLFFSNNMDGGLDVKSGTDNREFRIIPQLGVNWRYPFVRKRIDNVQIIEPILNFVLGPDTQNSSKIANEDSQAFEFDDTNIFDLNRYAGTDRITGGSRIDYGIRTSIAKDDGQQSELLLAQSYRFAGSSSFGEASGLEHKKSDYIGRFTFFPNDAFNINYRFRLDRKNFSPNRVELGLNLFHPQHTMGLDYILIDEQSETEEFGNREQLDLNINSQLLENWTSSLQLVQDFKDNSNRTIKASLGVTYTDECFTIGIQYQREDMSGEDLQPEDQVLLLINFRDLGSL